MELFLKVFLFVCKYLCKISAPIWSAFNRFYFKSVPIPPIENDLLLISATDLATQIRCRKISSVVVVNAYIDRIKTINPIINAVVVERFEDAVVEAQKADETVRNLGSAEVARKYPLLGVPFTVKENCSLKGTPINLGLPHRKGLIAQHDGDVVSNLRQAGAIPLLTSNVPVYCMNTETRNYINGTTRNPHDLSKSAGGSSGGEGALISSGASVFGIGSDLGGSVRIPAAFCGIFAHKPTGGVLPIKGCLPASFMNTNNVGPLCRYANDLPMLLEIMAGNNGKALRLKEAVDLSELKIYYMDELPSTIADIRVQSEIKESIELAVQYMKRKGFQVQPAPYLPLLEDRFEMVISNFRQYSDVPSMLQHSDNPQIVDNVFIEILKSFFGLSDYTLTPLLIEMMLATDIGVSRKNIPIYLKKGEQLKEQLSNLLGDNGVMIWPTWPTTANTHCNNATLAGIAFNYTALINYLKFASTHVPLGTDANGLPFGLQIIGAPMQDRLCLALAQELEVGFGGWIKPF